MPQKTGEIREEIYEYTRGRGYIEWWCMGTEYCYRAHLTDCPKLEGQAATIAQAETDLLHKLRGEERFDEVSRLRHEFLTTFGLEPTHIVVPSAQWGRWSGVQELRGMKVLRVTSQGNRLHVIRLEE